MRKFTFNDGKSDKFWNIDLQGDRLTVTLGRRGTAGRTLTKQFADAEKAHAAYDKLIAAKVKKGYREEAAPASRPIQRALEEALLADPEDQAAHAAYADCLTEAGDPRGEFIQVQLSLEDACHSAQERQELHKREQALLVPHGREWLGELAPYLLDQRGVGDTAETYYARYHAAEPYQFQFARGWLDSLHVPSLTVAFARVLAQAPQVRLLRRLTIEEVANETVAEYESGGDIPAANDDSPGLFPLIRSPHLSTVRVLRVGEHCEGPETHGYGSCHTRCEGGVELIAKMPRLEELYLFARSVDTETLFAIPTLGHLRILQVYHEWNYPLERLARNPCLGRLTHLLLHPHGLEPGDQPYINLAGLRALLQPGRLPSLTHLQLRLSDMGDRGCEEIVRSGILKRLKMLDLRHGCITDAGARTLADSPDLKNLELLDVNRNSLTAAGIAALMGVGIPVAADDQHNAREIEQNLYLYEGDPE
jgi:uncharacterized protein (TIGR02996 family)